MKYKYGITVGLEIHKKLNLEAARIVTGLPIFTNTEILYTETGWELLSVRQKIRKLHSFL
jgi:hypothetical protein